MKYELHQKIVLSADTKMLCGEKSIIESVFSFFWPDHEYALTD
jgi:hypothetical protein